MKIIELKNKLGQILVPKKWEPIGTIKMFDREQDMSKLYYGTWELTLKERSPMGINPNSTDDRFKTAGTQFGEKDHALTIAEMPNHGHSANNFVINNTSNPFTINMGGSGTLSTGTSNDYTGSVGGYQPHNNIHPVEIVYFYKRVA